MELAIRIASAVVFGPVLLAIVWFSETVGYTTFLALLVAGGGWEWARLAGTVAPSARMIFALAVAVITVAAITQLSLNLTLLFVGLGILLWLCNTCWLSRPKLLNAPTGSAFVIKILLGVIILSVAGLSLARIHQANLGAGLTVVFFLIIWSADIGAYAAGRLFGRHKLAPTISPGKTWEGALGGQVLVAFVVWLLARFTPPELGLGTWFFALAAITAAISVVGDLFISILKRQRQLKDTGRLLPGHGGVLDRFDSTFAAAPFFLAGLHWAGRL